MGHNMTLWSYDTRAESESEITTGKGRFLVEGVYTMKILVVGAGPTGLTTAIELARRGLKPTVVDRRDSASTLSRAVGITPRSLELLSQSGASETLISEGFAMDGLRVYYGESLSLSMPLSSNRAFHPNLVCLAQDRTETILADTLSKYGTQIHYGVQIDELNQMNDGVIARFNNREEEKYDHVVGADGIKSTVREQAGISYPGFDLDQVWSIADVDLEDWQHPGCLTMVQAGPGIVVVVVPLGESRYRVVASHENALRAMPLKLNVSTIRREGTFKISVRMASTYSTGKIHLAGDAAHCHSPVGGRGMNLGIADAAELARRLVEDDLEGYTTARHEEAMIARKITERGRKISTGHNFARRFMFRSLISGVKVLPSLRKRIGSFVVEF